MARPTQFDSILKNAIAAMVRKGESITSIADAIGVSRQALYYHLGADEEFFDKIVDAREMVTDLVENALLRSALGCTVLEERTTESPAGTNITTVKKSLPPNAAACIAWLQKKRAAEWGRMSWAGVVTRCLMRRCRLSQMMIEP
jgi:AcrR family transcriptional regulator